MWSQRRADDEFGAAVDIAGDDTAIHVALDDHFGHVESNAGSRFFGGKIRIEYFVQNGFGNSAAGVPDRNETLPAGGAQMNFDLAGFESISRRMRLDGFSGVGEEIEQHLGIFIGKSQQLHILGFIENQGDVVLLVTRCHQLNGRLHLPACGEDRLLLVGAEEIGEIVDGGGHFLNEAVAVRHDLFHICRIQGVEPVGIHDIGQNHTQGIQRLPPLMGDVGDHLSHGGHPVLIDENPVFLAEFANSPLDEAFKGTVEFLELQLFGRQCFLYPFLFRLIPKNQHHPRDGVSSIVNGCAADGNGAFRPIPGNQQRVVELFHHPVFPNHLFHRIVLFGAGVGVDDPEDLFQRFFRGFAFNPAGQLFGHRIHAVDFPRQARGDDSLADAVEGGAHLFLDFAQLPFGVEHFQIEIALAVMVKKGGRSDRQNNQ